MPAQVRPAVYKSGEWEIDLARRELRWRSVVVPLDARAFDIVEVLVQSAGELVSKFDLTNRVWPGEAVQETALKAHISAVHEALGPDRKPLNAVAGRGYRLLGGWTLKQENLHPGPVPIPNRAITFGPFRLNPERRLLLEADKSVAIGSRALEILIALVDRPGELVSKDQLIARAWPNTAVDESNLRAQIAALRRTLRDGRNGGRYITAVPGRGYRFVAAASHLEDERAPGAARERRDNLPGRLIQVIGRADVIGQLTYRLKRCRFVSIVGPGGIGKTTVAVAIASELSPSYQHGVFFLDLAPLADPHLVASALAATLSIATISDDPVGELIASIGQKHILLLLDSCEGAVKSAAILAESILKGAPNVDILTTSREPLRAEGESVHRLSPLPVPPSLAGLTAANAMTYPAVELFVERAASNVDGFQLTESNAPIVADICRQLDGIALAIELAAARVDAFSTREIAERLNDRFRLLTGGRRTALPRHQTLGATFDWSYELLSQHERVVLRRLAVFSGGFTLDAVSAVIANAEIPAVDLPDLLAQLIAKSLVVVETKHTVARYRLLDTTRAYGWAKLAESDEAELVTRRHAEYFRTVFEGALAEWQRRPAMEWLANYAWQIDNLRIALDWGFSPGGDPAIGMALTIGAIPLWFQLSSTDECRERVEHALASVDSEGRDARARQIMQLYLALGLSRTFTIGLAPQASAAWTKAFEIAENLGDKELQLEALWGLWFCHIGTGEYRAALEVAQQFCDLAETTSDLRMGDRLVGVPLHCLGQHSAARGRIEHLLSSDPPPSSSSPGVRFRFGQPTAARVILAQMLWLQGFPDQATSAARASVEETQITGHAISLCDALAQAACPIAMLVGDLPAAEQAIAMLLDQSSRHALDPWNVLGRAWQAALHLRRNNRILGLQLLRVTIEELREVRFAFYYTGFLGTLAESLANAGDIAQGLKVIDSAIARCSQKEELWYAPELLRIKGEILMKSELSNVALAEKQFLDSLDCARRQEALSWELRTTTSLARLRRSQDRNEEALISLAAVYDRFTEGFATNDLTMGKTLIDELSQTTPIGRVR